jgi:serine phosphatase RsbU (regulator of sigma subunit)/PAS domain-containing protein/anti-sigma regulatory factor (Ser/Thr protein kinase)
MPVHGPVPEPDAGHLDLVMDAAGVGWFDWDVLNDHLVFDERMCLLFGIEPETFDHRVGSFWSTLHPVDRPGIESAVAAALAACSDYSAEYRVVLPDGDVRWVEARGRVVADRDGRAARMLGVARDTTDQRMGRDAVARALEHMADGFVSVDDGWHVTFVNRNAEPFVGPPAEALGRSLWEVWPHLASGYERFVRDATRSGTTTSFDKYVVERSAWYRIRVVPHHQGTSFFISDVTASRAAELERERALTRPDQARAVLAYSAALAQADSLADVIDVVATMVLPAFGAGGLLVSLLESNRLSLAGHAGYPPEAVAKLAVLGPDDVNPIAQTLRTREPLFLPSREAYLGLFPGKEPLLEATGKHAWAFLPLTVSGRSLGSLTISFDAPRDFAPEEQSLLVSVSGLLAQTLARARLRDTERTLAAELQQQLLPRALPQPEGLRTAARYLAATEGMGVGGDWYDVLELPGQRVTVVIGDVQGHSMQAAAVMGQLRNGLRAYATEGHEPAAVMSRTNRLMLELDAGVFATCVIVTIDLRTATAEVVIAGHPPPIRQPLAGPAVNLVAPVGPPLGVVAGEEYRSGRVRLATGDVLVLFTDGLVEDAGRTFEAGLESVLATLSAVPASDLDGLADRLVAGSVDPEHLSDDVALLVVRHDGLPEQSRPAHDRTSIDRVDPRAARAARDFIARHLAEPELVDLRETAVLLVSEVVTNALRHSNGRVELELWRFSDRVRVEVSDETSRAPVVEGADPLSESGRGVPLMNALSDRWGTSPHGAGKVVWFELDLPGDRSAQSDSLR